MRFDVEGMSRWIKYTQYQISFIVCIFLKFVA